MENIQPQQQQMSQEQINAFVFDGYEAKVAKGVIYFEFNEKIGKAMLMHKIFNALGEHVDTITKPYSSVEIERDVIARRAQRDQLELQMLNLREQLQNFDNATVAIQEHIATQVKALEQKHQPSNPQKAERAGTN